MPYATSNQYIASVVKEFSGRFIGIGHIDFTRHPREQAEALLKSGLSGIKLHPRLQGIDLLDEDLHDFFSFLNQHKIPVMIDGYYQSRNRGIPLSSFTPFHYDALAKKYPDIPLILSHMGGHRVLDAFFLAKSNPSVFLDNSHMLRYFSGTSVIDDALWVMDKLDEKIIYGSDFPEYSLNGYLEHFKQLTSGKKEIRKEKIYSNITKIFHF